MVAFICKRFLQSIAVLLLVSVFTYSLLYLMPGDPVYAMLGGDITQEQYDIAYDGMGLDKPVIVRYLGWLLDMLRGDFGQSYKYNEPVIQLIAVRLPVTIYLGLISILISTMLGILFGILSSTNRGKKIDTVITLVANVGAVTPLFWLAVLGMYIFSMNLGWLPSYGFSFPGGGNLLQSVKQTILPVIALSASAVAGTTRQMRSSMLEVIRQDYMRTARAVGYSEGAVVVRHGMKNALIPVITLIGMSFKNVVAGSVSVETIFTIAGMGNLLVNSILSKDVAATQACIMIIAVVVSVVNLIVDISYGYLDPRIRVQ